MAFSSLKNPSLSELGNGILNLFVIRRDSSGGSYTSSSISTVASSSSSNDAALVQRKTGPSSTRSSSSGGGGGGKDAGTVSKKEDEIGTVIAEIFISIILSGTIYAVGLGMWKVSQYYFNILTGNESEDVDHVKSSAVHRLTQLLEKRGRALDKPLRLTSHESHIAEDIVDPDDMDSGFKDIGGLDHLKQEVWELAVLPLLRPELFSGTSKLVQQPSGILLYGKPGTGKTMLAKAIAKESQAVFIPIKLSKILNKWVGESNKLVAATFTLARKLAPSIIFIDEIDTFLSDTVDPSASKSMESVKSEFLTEWDGVATNRDRAPVLVVGATNRPQLLDPAIQRRLPRHFAVPLPNANGREQIIRVLFEGENLDDSAKAFITPLAKDLTQGYSGSDLKELCKAAAMEPVRDIVAEEARKAVMGESTPKPTTSTEEDDNREKPEAPKLRAVTKNDLRMALNKVKRTGQVAKEYGAEMAYEKTFDMDPQNPQSVFERFSSMSPQQLQAVQQMMMQLLQSAQNNSPPTAATNGGDSDGDTDVPDLN